jgi:hypothetical protein
MRFEGMYSAVSSRAKCIDCKEPIIKKEGVMRIGYGGGYTCYKCSKKWVMKQIEHYKERLKTLDKLNRISKERMEELKLVRKL